MDHDSLLIEFGYGDLVKPVMSARVKNLLDGMTEVMFDNYFNKNFLFQYEMKQLDNILRNYNKEKIVEFKSIIENINAEEKILLSKQLLHYIKSTRKYRKYGITSLEKQLKIVESIEPMFLKYNIFFNDENVSILQLAVQWKIPEIVSYLISNGANINYISNRKSDGRKSILSYLVMCNCEESYMDNFSTRISKICETLTYIVETTRLFKIPNHKLDLYRINTDPVLIGDILQQMSINIYADEYCSRKTCSEQNIRLILEEKIPNLLLNKSDSIFLKQHVDRNGLNFDETYSYFFYKCKDYIESLEKNTEKKMMQVLDYVPHRNISRLYKLALKTKIFLCTKETLLNICAGFVPEHFEMVLKNPLMKFSYNIDDVNLSTICLDGLDYYNMPIQLCYEKLKILFDFVHYEVGEQISIFEYIQPKDGYPAFNEFSVNGDSGGFLSTLLRCSLPRMLDKDNLENRKEYFKWFNKIIRLIMTYKGHPQVFLGTLYEKTKLKRRKNIIVMFVRLFNPLLLKEVYSSTDANVFSLSCGNICDDYISQVNINNFYESLDTLETYFCLPGVNINSRSSKNDSVFFSLLDHLTQVEGEQKDKLEELVLNVMNRRKDIQLRSEKTTAFHYLNEKTPFSVIETVFQYATNTNQSGVVSISDSNGIVAFDKIFSIDKLGQKIDKKYIKELDKSKVKLLNAFISCGQPISRLPLLKSILSQKLTDYHVELFDCIVREREKILLSPNNYIYILLNTYSYGPYDSFQLYDINDPFRGPKHFEKVFKSLLKVCNISELDKDSRLSLLQYISSSKNFKYLLTVAKEINRPMDANKFEEYQQKNLFAYLFSRSLMIKDRVDIIMNADFIKNKETAISKWVGLYDGNRSSSIMHVVETIFRRHFKDAKNIIDLLRIPINKKTMNAIAQKILKEKKQEEIASQTIKRQKSVEPYKLKF